MVKSNLFLVVLTYMEMDKSNKMFFKAWIFNTTLVLIIYFKDKNMNKSFFKSGLS